MPQVLSELEQSLESALQRFAARIDTRQLAPDASSSPAFSCSLPFTPGFAPRAAEKRPRAQRDSHRSERSVCDASSLPCLSLRVGFALRTSVRQQLSGRSLALSRDELSRPSQLVHCRATQATRSVVPSAGAAAWQRGRGLGVGPYALAALAAPRLHNIVSPSELALAWRKARRLYFTCTT